MMKITVALLLFGFFSIANPQQPSRSAARTPGNEPFRTFELLDTRLAILSKQQGQVKQALFPAPTTKATTTKPNSRMRPWTKASQNALQTARTIRTLAERQQQRYKTIKQAFGARAFGALANRAAGLEQAAQVLATTQNEAVAKKQQPRLEERSLSLVLQYQAIAGGYGATHCSPGALPCCEPTQDSPAANGEEIVSCKWVCVASVAKCAKGFTGPRTAGLANKRP